MCAVVEMWLRLKWNNTTPALTLILTSEPMIRGPNVTCSTWYLFFTEHTITFTNFPVIVTFGAMELSDHYPSYFFDPG